MSALRITAVLPTYQRAHLLPGVLASIFAQERRPDEIVVVDDGSTDDTRAVLARYPEVRSIQQANRGASVARNVGVEAASGEWIAFLDSDDTWTPGHVAALERAALATSTSADVYAADLRLSAAAGSRRLFEVAGLDVPEPFLLVEDAREQVLLPHLPIMLQASLIRRSAFQRVGGLDSDLPTRHDTHLFLLLGIAGSVCFVPHLGCEMGGDAEDDRLTTNARDGERYFEETVHLYEDVLARCELSRAERLVLGRQVAVAARVLAGRRWRAGERWQAARELARSLGRHPGPLLRSLQRRIRGR